MKSSKLNDHLLDDVFCSLIPYSEKIKGVDAVTVSNRTIQLLSFGIPIITKEMKFSLIKKNVILSYDTKDQLYKNLKETKLKFYDFQKDIKNFVEENSETIRYKQFMKIINNK